MTRATLLAVCLAAALHAQYPPDMQWRKIVTPHFEIVFPKEIERDAQRAANTLETLYGPLTETLGTSFKRVTVLLPNQGVTRYVGGFVSLFPRMATFNSMPSQGFWGTNDWLTVLAADEGRHLAQLSKMNHGVGKMASIMFGESGLAAVLGWTLPDWWIMGDSRVAQSLMLRGGIGQFGSSEETTRALLMSGQRYSYMKAIHGSFKDAVASPEELGSFLVSHVDRTSGPDTWSKIMARTADSAWNPFALSRAMKQETGRSAATNYYDAMSELGELFNTKAQNLQFSQPRIVNTAPKLVATGYYQPVYEADGSVLAQKVGLDTFPVEMVRIHPDGREEKVLRLGPSVITSNRTSVVNGRMVWDAYIPDVRWRRGYSVIMIRDMATGHTRTLTHGTRFMNPVLSPDGARVAVVEFLPDRACSLVVIDAANGAELRRLASPGNDMIYSPAWSEDGHRIAMVTQSGRGRALVVADLDAGTFHEAIAHSDEEIGNPVVFGEYILYKSSLDGVVNIYAVETASGRRYRVTSSKFGANFPAISPDRTKLLYSDYTAQGYNLAELPLDPNTWRRVETAPYLGLGYHGQVHDYSAEVPNIQHPVAIYHPLAHLFAIHSWGFTSGPPDLGYGLISDDKMGLMDFHASVLYNSNEHTPGFSTGVSYNRFFPQLQFGFTDRNRSLQFADHKENFTERTASAGFRIPLNFSRGYYNTFVNFGANIQSIGLQGGGLVPLGYTFNFSRTRQSSARDVVPTWAQILRFTYRQTMDARPYTANYLAADGRFAIPGLIKHQSLVLEGGYERQNGTYTYSSQLQFPRGYQAFTGANLTKFSSTYRAPLFYPDWALGQLLYIKRITGDLFYDYGKVADRQFRSTGVEAVFDVNLLHFPVPLRAGVRYAYRIDYGNRRIQPFLAYSW